VSFPAELIAWTLLHFLWQGVLCTLLGGACLSLTRWQGAERRYAIWLLVLGAMVVAPCVTMTWLVTNPSMLASDPAPPLDRQATDPLLLASTEPPRDLTRILSELAATESGAEVVWRLATDAKEPASVTIPQAMAPSTTAQSWPWSRWIVAGWVLGIGITSLRLIGAVTWMSGVVRRLEPVPVEVEKLAARLSRHLGLRALPTIRLSRAVREPLALQWSRPLILLPASWLADVPVEVLEAVLAHELAHIKRHDLWVNLAQRLVETLFFFHPCVWWVSRRIREERELCCDALAVSVTRRPVVYAQALETAARRCRGGSPVAGLFAPRWGVGWGGTRMALLHRVKRVLGVAPATTESHWWSVGLAGMGLSAACWFGTTLLPATAAGVDDAEDFEVRLAADDRPDREGPPEGRPPREGRPEGRPEGPPPGEPGRGGPRPPGPPRGEMERGRGGPPPGEGRRPDGPPHDGRRPEGPRPIPEILEELQAAMRQLDERGPEGQREKMEILHHLMRSMAAPAPGPRGEHRAESRVFVFDMSEDEPARRGPGVDPRREPRPEEGPRDVMDAMRELREEVHQLRREMEAMRQGGPRGPGMMGMPPGMNPGLFGGPGPRPGFGPPGEAGRPPRERDQERPRPPREAEREDDEPRGERERDDEDRDEVMENEERETPPRDKEESREDADDPIGDTLSLIEDLVVETVLSVTEESAAGAESGESEAATESPE
jgi:Zn-dependent protease with chaperone function